MTSNDLMGGRNKIALSEIKLNFLISTMSKLLQNMALLNNEMLKGIVNHLLVHAIYQHGKISFSMVKFFCVEWLSLGSL